MKDKNKAILTVQMPPELRRELEALAVERGESLSLTTRDLVRAAVDAARRGESPIAPPSARAFR
jgi:hypothetical protein